MADPTGPDVARHDRRRPGRRRGDRDHRRLLAGQVPEGAALLAGQRRLSLGVAGNDQGGGAGERAGALHRLHRLRVDVEHRRQQPAPQRHLPRQRREGQPGRAVHGRWRRSAATTRATSGSGWPAYEDKTGGDVLAIAHNGNLSNGRMFPMVEPGTGKRIDREYAETRAKWERLYEATQIKGDGEAHPYLSPNDEFANFERWDKGNLDLSEAKTPDMLQYEYARSGLKLGLKLEGELGVNPYKFGLVGSTDAHTGLAAVEEDNYFGKTSAMEPSADRSSKVFVKGKGGTIYEWETVVIGVCGGLGDREHARGAVRRHGAPRDLRDDRLAHGGAPLRRLRLRGGRREHPKPGGRRLHEGRADGRRPRPGPVRQGADLPRRGPEGPHRGQSRPLPDRQGLGRRQGRGAGEGLRRRLVGRAQARSRTASCRRSGTPSTSPTRTGPTPSAPPSSSRSGGIPSSIRSSAPSTTGASSRSRRRAGRPTTPSTTA